MTCLPPYTLNPQPFSRYANDLSPVFYSPVFLFSYVPFSTGIPSILYRNPCHPLLDMGADVGGADVGGERRFMQCCNSFPFFYLCLFSAAALFRNSVTPMYAARR